MKILLADPHPEVRTALRLVLEQQAGLLVLGEIRDAFELVAQAVQDCPDVILLDPDLPGVRASLEKLVAALKARCPCARVVALSSHPGAERECLEAGAEAFFCKSDPPDALLAFLREGTGRR